MLMKEREVNSEFWCLGQRLLAMAEDGMIWELLLV